MDDLAERITDAAVAAVDLVPGEPRFAALSRHVLRGGASRFAPVVRGDEEIRYVIPVAVPGERLDFGTLVIQQTRCCLVWRPDATRPFRAQVIELGTATRIAQTPCEVRGEIWGRFDVRRPGMVDATFLVPPVASPALPRMLRRVLVDEPGSALVRMDLAPLSPEILSPATDASLDPGTTAAMPAVVEVGPSAPSGSARLAPEVPPVARADAAPALRMDLSAPPAVALPDEELFRDSARATPPPRPVPAPLPAPPAADVARFDSPVPAPGAGRRRWMEFDDDHSGRWLADLLKGFLMGFLVTLIAGGIYLILRIVGVL